MDSLRGGKKALVCLIVNVGISRKPDITCNRDKVKIGLVFVVIGQALGQLKVKLVDMTVWIREEKSVTVAT